MNWRVGATFGEETSPTKCHGKWYLTHALGNTGGNLLLNSPEIMPSQVGDVSIEN